MSFRELCRGWPKYLKTRDIWRKRHRLSSLWNRPEVRCLLRCSVVPFCILCGGTEGTREEAGSSIGEGSGYGICDDMERLRCHNHGLDRARDIWRRYPRTPL